MVRATPAHHTLLHAPQYTTHTLASPATGIMYIIQILSIIQISLINYIIDFVPRRLPKKMARVSCERRPPWKILHLSAICRCCCSPGGFAGLPGGWNYLHYSNYLNQTNKFNKLYNRNRSSEPSRKIGESFVRGATPLEDVEPLGNLLLLLLLTCGYCRPVRRHTDTQTHPNKQRLTQTILLLLLLLHPLRLYCYYQYYYYY